VTKAQELINTGALAAESTLKVREPVQAKRAENFGEFSSSKRKFGSFLEFVCLEISPFRLSPKFCRFSEFVSGIRNCIPLPAYHLKLHSPHFHTLLIWMNGCTTDFFQNEHRTIIALLSKVLEQHRRHGRSNASKNRSASSTEASGGEVWTV
jgi:hypothetical protein